ncbi:uncharacterized protein A4U43_C08F30970 [Asparagus officinalis]|uniref:uncharacterized protein LOC109822838 isoform X2 n=1 Tax=Asparagus officinalis TaxID=4686 RepID=UPI00098DED42|nr:uncharacterized protein LOC109822838 isoform X2 [Asparagus officinalis]ONK61535.1 uncharacterized protein A4U43_C08F30970 [Asparagus officinalis]
MEAMGEGGGERGELGLGFTEIETNAEGLKPSEIFHIVKELIGFVLYMHHQIPSVLQHLEDEFDALKDEYKGLESTSVKESKASLQRQHNMRKREVKSGIKRLEKLMNAISSLVSALKEAIDGTSNIHGVTLVLGASPARPQHVYEMFFPCGRVDSGDTTGCIKSKVAEALSRKVIRALISSGAGSASYTGPTKLFLLVRSPCTLNLPLHFLPKRDFKYHKKAVPFRLHIKSKTYNAVVGGCHHTSEIGPSASPLHSTSDDVLWFQCRHTVRGLPSKASEAGC